MQKKYDLFIALGNYCLASDGLRKSKLQNESLPMDWLKIDNSTKAVNLLTSHFNGLLNIENLKKTDLTSGLHRIYTNKHLGVEFRHDFLANLSLEENMPTVRAKYERRIQRLYEKIHYAKDILFLNVCDNPRRMSKNELEGLHHKIKNLYPQKNIFLLAIHLSLELQEPQILDINDNIRFVEFGIANLSDYGTHKKIVANYLRNYNVNYCCTLKNIGISCYFKLRKTMLKIMMHLPVSNSLKQQLRILYKDRY